MAINLSEIPTRIKRLRGNAAQSEFALECRLTQAQVSAYELGKMLPSLDSLKRMCESRGITIAAFLEEEEMRTAPPRAPSKEEMALWIIRALGIDGFPLDACKRALIKERV